MRAGNKAKKLATLEIVITLFKVRILLVCACMHAADFGTSIAGSPLPGEGVM